MENDIARAVAAYSRAAHAASLSGETWDTLPPRRWDGFCVNGVTVAFVESPFVAYAVHPHSCRAINASTFRRYQRTAEREG